VNAAAADPHAAAAFVARLTGAGSRPQRAAAGFG
jgi:hypothetical protein